jgi:hypothetical protein
LAVLRDDDPLDFRGLLYQQVGGLLAFENPAGVAAGPAIGFGAVRTVGHEPPDAAALLSSPIHGVGPRTGGPGPDNLQFIAGQAEG